jgi:hypothetical protein
VEQQLLGDAESSGAVAVALPPAASPVSTVVTSGHRQHSRRRRSRSRSRFVFAIGGFFCFLLFFVVVFCYFVVIVLAWLDV